VYIYEALNVSLRIKVIHSVPSELFILGESVRLYNPLPILAIFMLELYVKYTKPKVVCEVLSKPSIYCKPWHFHGAKSWRICLFSIGSRQDSAFAAEI
jgi:hypothetical protein